MYKPISDYGIIGNLHSVALVGIDGSVDWCCFPHLDSPSVFAALLDDEKGGRFQIAPVAYRSSSQVYHRGTNVLDTVFVTDGGRVRLTDFMPVAVMEGSEAGVHRIYRRVACEEGQAVLRAFFQPRFNYARGETRLTLVSRGVLADHPCGDGAILCAPVDLNVRGNAVEATFPLRQGETAWWVLRYGEHDQCGVDVRECESRLREAREFWRSWVQTCEHPCLSSGPWHDQAQRSGLVLKLLFGPTGGVAAAATTSLPEQIGGTRNWDYRFTWIRDASFTLQALYALGHHREAEQFFSWLCHIFRRRKDPKHIRVVYGMNGEEDFQEEVLDHLQGYRGSRPVRIGNAAVGQRQLDIYGELLDAALRFYQATGKLSRDLWKMLRAVVDHVCEVWWEPDWGIWEVRSGPKHFVHSKVMCWVAVDRAIRLADAADFGREVARWRRVREEIRNDVLAHGWSEREQAFVQHFGTDRIDASALLMPLVGFLPIGEPRMQSTIEAVVRELGQGGLLRRYSGGDGLEGSEGAFLLCSFWLVDCLTLSGRIDEACSLFETLRGYANHLGLYSEQIDPSTHELLGNFPQAFTHIGFVNSALLLGQALGGETVRDPADWAFSSPGARGVARGVRSGPWSVARRNATASFPMPDGAVGPPAKYGGDQEASLVDEV